MIEVKIKLPLTKPIALEWRAGGWVAVAVAVAVAVMVMKCGVRLPALQPVERPRGQRQKSFQKSFALRQTLAIGFCKRGVPARRHLRGHVPMLTPTRALICQLQRQPQVWAHPRHGGCEGRAGVAPQGELKTPRQFQDGAMPSMLCA